MIKIQSVANYDHANKKVTGKLFSDTKAEIQDGMKIVGLPEGYSMDFGSSVMTADAELAFLKSDGTWNWKA